MEKGDVTCLAVIELHLYPAFAAFVTFPDFMGVDPDQICMCLAAK